MYYILFLDPFRFQIFDIFYDFVVLAYFNANFMFLCDKVFKLHLLPNEVFGGGI